MTGKRPAVLGLALAMVLFLGACSRMAANSVLADALFSQNTLELPIGCTIPNMGTYPNLGATRYTSRLNYREQLSIVQETCGAENVQEYSDHVSGSRIHIHLPGEDGKADDYLLSMYWGGDGGKPNYIFSGMSAVIEYGTEDENPTILLPYHLISDARVTRLVKAALYAGAEYETDHRQDEFYDFYEASGWYETEKSEGSFTITKDDRTFTFTFTAHAGQVFFSVA